MRCIIAGKAYDTGTAETICDISAPGYSVGDFQWDQTFLYRTPNGAFFIAGKGGPQSRWAMPQGNNGYAGGNGLKPVTLDEAKAFVEQFSTAAEYERLFGPAEEA